VLGGWHASWVIGGVPTPPLFPHLSPTTPFVPLPPHRFDAPEDFAPFKLAEGLFYASALENAASAMEIAAIEGRMAALLAAQHLRQAASPTQQQQQQQQQGSVLDGPGQGAANQQEKVAAAA
jgi:hypothetical protein